MPQHKEWHQEKWTRPNVAVARDPGDFDSLDSLLIDPTERKLMRGPTWSTFVDLPDDLIDPMAVFRDRYGTTVFVGHNASTNLASLTYDSSWTPHAHSHELNATPQWPGGQMHQNCPWWGGYLWVIGDDTLVYRGTSHSAALTAFYSTPGAQVLFPVGEHMYLVDNTGLILRSDATCAAFETYFDPIVTLDVMFGCGLRGNIVLVARMADGTMRLYRLPDQNPIGLHELAHIPATGQHATGIAACVHNDDLYLMPGYNQVSTGGATYQDYDLFRFDGSSLEHLDRLRQAALTYHNLFSWNDRLMLHTYDHTSHNHLFYALVGKGLTGALPTINNNTSITYMAAFPCGDDVVVCGDSPAHGFWYAGRGNKSDGNFVTSRLDMGYPGLLKRLHRITVLMDGMASNYKVVISHRIDDTTSYTTDLTTSNTLRPSIDFNAPTVFYQLQVKVAIDDDSGSNLDHRIVDVAVDYSID